VLNFRVNVSYPTISRHMKEKKIVFQQQRKRNMGKEIDERGVCEAVLRGAPATSQ
jgi:hypothetical protein